MVRPKTNKDGLPLDRPFDAAIWSAAERIAADYQLVLWREDGRWYGRGVELPYACGDGATPAKCVAMTLEGLAINVACLLEKGEQPPTPQRKTALEPANADEAKALVLGAPRENG